MITGDDGATLFIEESAMSYLKVTAAIVAVGVGVLVLRHLGGMDDPSGGTPFSALQAVVDKEAKSPSTVVFIKTEVLDKSGLWVAGYVEFDSRNEYNAVIRTRACIVAEQKGNSVSWDSRWGFDTTCDYPVSRERIVAMEKRNGWPTPGEDQRNQK